MKTNSADINHRTYTDVTGIPADRDLHITVPRRAYRIDEPQLKNRKPIVQLLLGREKGPNGIINAPIHSVVQAERNIWRFRGYNHEAAVLSTQVYEKTS